MRYTGGYVRLSLGELVGNVLRQCRVFEESPFTTAGQVHRSQWHTLVAEEAGEVCEVRRQDREVGAIYKSCEIIVDKYQMWRRNTVTPTFRQGAKSRLLQDPEKVQGTSGSG